jgi:DNA-binding beta-propeller fold protein YncE
VRGRLVTGVAVAASLAATGSAGAVEPVYVTNYDTNGGHVGVSQFTIGVGGLLKPDPTPTAAAGNAPYGIVVSPNKKYVYVSNGRSNGHGGISQYTIGAGGMLKPDPKPTVAAGKDPEGIVESPNGDYVYVTNSAAAGSVSQYTVGVGGMLKPDPKPTVPAGKNPGALAISPNGKYVYVPSNGPSNPSTSSVSQYTVGAGGMLKPDPTPSVAAGKSPQTIAISPNGEYVYVGNYYSGISQYTVGAGGMLQPDATPQLAFSATTAPAGMVVSPTGSYVYVAEPENPTQGGDGPGEVLQYTVGAGGMLNAAPVGATPAGFFPIGIGLSPSGQDVYVVDEGNGHEGISQFTIAAGGSLSPVTIPFLADLHGPVGIAF